jgi:DNA invertase Pin-like site-specific DNA recombinase
VHKIDRLSRSLRDFAKLIELFEEHGITLASATQPFSTATSSGRLMLHMLLSLAEYEREMIGERIRDKFTASRARGMWMGGRVPLGYDVRDRKLVVNQTEAAVIQRIFTGFAQLASGAKLTQVLRAEGVTTKSGRPINKGNIYKLRTTGPTGARSNTRAKSIQANIRRSCLEIYGIACMLCSRRAHERGPTRTEHRAPHCCRV